jgi:Holliday junction resolvase RusA-like endonuclease
MGYSISFEIAYHPTDANRMRGKNWTNTKKLFDSIKQEVYYSSLGKTPPSPLTAFKISITRLGAKYLDWDNFVSSLKPVIDGLTLAKIIKDDGWTYIRNIELDQIKSKESKLQISVIENEGI